MARPKVLIAMSGGVDSSVAAYLIKKKGYDVIGANMKLFDMESLAGALESCSNRDTEDAEKVAKKLDIPFFVPKFQADFNKNVVDPFITAYEEGSTPNPCVYCNRTIKFGLMHKFAKENACDYVVTGHYARVEFNEDTGKYELKKAINLKKDQSYVLFSLSQDKLAKTMFPLGYMNKEEVRAIAEAQGFDNAGKKESQDICFVPDGDYVKFIKKYTGKEYPEGNIVDQYGNVLGKHKGIISYTIGQRKGLGLSLPHSMYVCDKNVGENTIILGENEDLFKQEVFTEKFNWISGETPKGDIRGEVKIRYSQNPKPATITPMKDGKVRIFFDEAERAVTKGQAAVVYDGDKVLGGGLIL